MGQKLVENAKIVKFKLDNLDDFQPTCRNLKSRFAPFLMKFGVRLMSQNWKSATIIRIRPNSVREISEEFLLATISIHCRC